MRCDESPSTGRLAPGDADRDARDRAILDANADELNREMEDVLAYQAAPARRPSRQ
jgi:hypothetical protein